MLKLNGNCGYTIDGRYSVSAPAASLACLPMGKPYVAESIVPGDCCCVNFHIDRESDLTGFSYQVRNFHKWHGLFTSLLHAWNYRLPGYQARVTGIVYDMFAAIVEDCSAQYLPARQRNAIQDMIQSPRVESTTVSIREMASLYGASPKQYIADVRFRQAGALLSTTDTAVSEIAKMCGFENTYLFSRAFHIREGNGPGEYRKNNREEKR